MSFFYLSVSMLASAFLRATTEVNLPTT